MYGFDVYYSDPLNRAHLLDRKAEVALSNEHYDEAIKFHNEAAKLLQNVKFKTNELVLHESAILSLDLQIKYHLKQESIVTLQKEQREMSRELMLKNTPSQMMRSSQEGFQNINMYSTTSLESYDSTDYVLTSAYSNGMNNSADQLVKRDEVIKKMGMFIRQQQNEILALSNRLKEKGKEIVNLKEKIRTLEGLSTNVEISSKVCNSVVECIGEA